MHSVLSEIIAEREYITKINKQPPERPEPRWVEGEMLLCQKFFIHHTYMCTFTSEEYTHHNTVQAEEKAERKAEKKMRQQEQALLKGQRKQDRAQHRHFDELFQNKMNPSIKPLDKVLYKTRKVQNPLKKKEKSSSVSKYLFATDESLPGPSGAAASLLILLNYFSDGMKELFPNNEMSGALRCHLSNSDSIHTMQKLQNVLVQLDKILENQVKDHLSKHDANINLISCRSDLINEIKTSYILALKHSSSLEKADNKSFQNIKPVLIKNDKWCVELSMKEIYENEHKIHFINNTRYLCKLCGGIFFNNPSSHIITPVHISALAELN